MAGLLALLGFHLALLLSPQRYPLNCSPEGASDAEGDLRIYDAATQNGTVAVREFRDEQGRVYMAVYYTRSFRSGAREFWPLRPDEIGADDLRASSVQMPTYDEAGRLIRHETFSPDGALLRHVRTIEYDAAGRKMKSRSTWKGAGASRHYETSVAARGDITELLDPDENLIAFAGHVPDGRAPPGGWGDTSGGTAVHLAVTPDRGRPLQIRLALTAFDLKARKTSTYVGVFPYLELRDSNNRVVPPIARYLERVRQYSQNLPPNGAACDTRDWLGGPGGLWEMDFEEVYGDVPPGLYTLVAGACRDGQGAISNPVLLTIEPPDWD